MRLGADHRVGVQVATSQLAQSTNFFGIAGRMDTRQSFCRYGAPLTLAAPGGYSRSFQPPGDGLDSMSVFRMAARFMAQEVRAGIPLAARNCGNLYDGPPRPSIANQCRRPRRAIVQNLRL